MWKDRIGAFISERLSAKQDKLADDDPRRADVLAQHESPVWLADAARRVAQIQAVTHSLKPIHPDARGTNLYVEPSALPSLSELGSHALGQHFVGDVVGNAAALDVYKLLKLEVNGRSLLAALLAQDADALAALHTDPAQAQALRDAFVSLTQPRAEGPSSHTLAKQLYWLTGSDACADADYTLWLRSMPPRWPMPCTPSCRKTASATPTRRPAKRGGSARRMTASFTTTPAWPCRTWAAPSRRTSASSTASGAV